MSEPGIIKLSDAPQKLPGKIYAAMAEVMKKVTPIAKSGYNTMQKFNFRGIDDIYNALNGIMAEAGVFSLPEVIEQSTEERQAKSGGTNIYRLYKIRYTFYCSDGSSVSSVVVGEGMDSGDKASNKAMAVAHKYALLQAFCIPTQEPKDPDADDQARNQAEQALANPGIRWENAVRAFAAYNKSARDILNYVKRPNPESVTDQDHEKLLAWYGELERGAT